MTPASRTLARRLGPLAAVVVLIVWTAAVGYRTGWWETGRIDRTWNALTGTVDAPWLHGAAQLLAIIGTGLPAVVEVLLLAVVVGLRCGLVWAGTVIVAGASSSLDVSAIKSVAGRVRPDSAYGWENSFPSGHTALAALLAALTALLLLHGWSRLLPASYPLAMAWSRTQLHAHWLSDVLAGAALGSATAVLLLVLVDAVRNAVDPRRLDRPADRARSVRRQPTPGGCLRSRSRRKDALPEAAER